MAGLQNLLINDHLSPYADSTLFFKGPFPASFSLFLSFQYSGQYIGNKKFAEDWIRTADLWCWKRPLYQVPTEPQPLPFYNTLPDTFHTQYFHYVGNIRMVRIEK